MFKVEDIQNYGKEQFETAVAHATSLQSGLSAIVTRLWRLRQEVLRGHQVLRGEALGREVARQGARGAERICQAAYETFVADAQKIAGLYGDLAKQAVKPLEGVVAKFTPAR